MSGGKPAFPTCEWGWRLKLQRGQVGTFAGREGGLAPAHRYILATDCTIYLADDLEDLETRTQHRSPTNNGDSQCHAR